MKVYIIGYMGSGKTTVGRKLASRLNIPFYDLDSLIQKETNKSIEDIFNEEGESYFRELESQILKKYSEADNFIFSTGGGTPCFNKNMEFINNQGISIYLKSSPEFLVSRLQFAKTIRPIIQGKSFEELHSFITNHLADREVFYNQAHHTINAIKPDLDKLVELL